ncbi:hypothetical protein JTE90_011101 [Oedothorax gibbosus]|uniref:Uncharacterized protein n=1 Tax=Oedothorax gibbosus TaxID=931172 RepID=A0AAV6U1E9_9ARAC|nr:hypothetical protein JTE90_011101 [Oedothorax gibbosus]
MQRRIYLVGRSSYSWIHTSGYMKGCYDIRSAADRCTWSWLTLGMGQPGRCTLELTDIRVGSGREKCAGVACHQRWVRLGDVRWSSLGSDIGEAGTGALGLPDIRDG